MHPPTTPRPAAPAGTDPTAASADPTAAERKDDHITMAFAAQTAAADLDARFAYEPLLAAHPAPGSLAAVPFAGRRLAAPLWVSSMTGGTGRARRINANLARACREFGMGMGLGSCRSLLYDDARLADFDMRDAIGDELPLYANLGVAQLETLFAEGAAARIPALVDKLRADGLIVHVNPLQEWLQPEGDRFAERPLDTVLRVLEVAEFPVIVKEVGQGFGPASVRELLRLPLAAIEFAAGGGTNFAKLELLRSDPVRQGIYRALERVGHSAAEMVGFVNDAVADLGEGEVRCGQVIISGGVRDFLDGHYLRAKCALPSVYGQASAFLRHATGDYEALRSFVATQIRGLELAEAYLKVL